MRIIEQLLHHLPQPALERLIAWRKAYPNTPLKYLPLPVQAEVKQILTTAIAPTETNAAARPQPVLPGPRQVVSPPRQTNGHTSAQPANTDSIGANGIPRPAPPRTPVSLTTVIGTDLKTGLDIGITEAAKQQGCYIIGANGTGNTNLLKTMITADIKAGLGV
jgi:hypothetical protein